MTILGERVDPDGRQVLLDRPGWAHVLAEHGEMKTHRDAVLQTIREPEHRRPDRRPSRPRALLASWKRPDSVASGDHRLQRGSRPRRDRLRQP